MKMYVKLVKSQSQKVCLEPPLKNNNNLCSPVVFWHADSQIRAIKAECMLTCILVLTSRHR